MSDSTLREIAEFLDGSAPLEGVWFGEPHPTERGAFWWRSRLTAALSADDAARGTMRERFEAHMSENGKWPRAIERSGDSYKLAAAMSAWTTWQACWDQASRAAAPQSVEPVAWCDDLNKPQPHCVTNLRYCSAAQVDRGEHLKYVPVFAAPPTAPTDAEWLFIAMDDDGRSHLTYCADRAAVRAAVVDAVWASNIDADDPTDNEQADGITETLIEDGEMRFEGDPPLYLFRLPAPPTKKEQP